MCVSCPVVFREFGNKLVGIEHFLEIMNTESEIQDDSHPQELLTSHEEIEFRNVTFQYSPEKVILDDVSFVIPAKQRVALV